MNYIFLGIIVIFIIILYLITQSQLNLSDRIKKRETFVTNNLVGSGLPYCCNGSNPTTPTTPTTPTNPTIPSTNPTIPSTNPTIPSSNPTIPSTNPTIPSSNPTIPSSNPTIPSTNPIPAGQPPSGTWQKCNFTTATLIGEAQKADGSDNSCHSDFPQIMNNCPKSGSASPFKYLQQDEYDCSESGKGGIGCSTQSEVDDEAPCMKQPCFLHGPISTGTCTIGHYLNDDVTSFNNKWAIIKPNIGKMITVTVGNNKYPAMISAGHGVLNGKCGSIALIRYGTPPKYLMNFQIGPRAWSLELYQQGLAHLGLKGNTTVNCQVPYVMRLNWNNITKGGSSVVSLATLNAPQGVNYMLKPENKTSGCVFVGKGTPPQCSSFTTEKSCNMYSPGAAASKCTTPGGWCCQWKGSPEPIQSSQPTGPSSGQTTMPSPPSPTTPSPTTPSPLSPSSKPASGTTPSSPSSSPSSSSLPQTGKCNYKYNDVVTTVKSAADILQEEPKYQKYLSSTIPFSELPYAWKDAGMNPKLCKYAMVILGGECGSSSNCKACCALAGSTNNASGILQCDSCRGVNSKPCKYELGDNATKCQPAGGFVGCPNGKYGPNCELNLKNPVSNMWAAVNTVMFPQHGLNDAYNQTAPGCQFAAGIKDQDCTQYIGPFCHHQAAPSCSNWIDNGTICQEQGPATTGSGGAWNGTPFPDYYYQTFLQNIEGGSKKPPGAETRSAALAHAEEYCKVIQ